ncbi:hypothetical protein L0F51_03960 [Afifella sp. H1R]|uniref:hypothetical protein n=1 Tax=Afifella sp. H1R TaxID=2908841 RepID=UPI001F3A3B53|nr:hypothetical protein [Afifella sp. H1R]MCF1502921.1 hypothetical protein [Afifella sp. H1R]
MPTDDAPRVMLSIGQIAEREGVSKQAISKIVKKLVDEHGVPVERDGRGRIARVSLAHFEHHRGHYTNPAKRSAVAAVSQSANADPGSSEARSPSDSFEEARRLNEWLKLERGRIEHLEELKQLVRADKLRDALEAIGREIQAAVNRLQNQADDLAVAVSKEGVHGARVKLRAIAFDLNEDIAARLAAIGTKAPAEDDVVKGEASG